MTQRESRPPPTTGMHHVALNVSNFEATKAFYVEILGLAVEWEPDNDNVYLTSGSDNIALHRVTEASGAVSQRLDHIGFLIDEKDDVDSWHTYLLSADVQIVAPPRTHRDGARSFYCRDPNGVTIQFIHHPPLAHH
ncbi:MAG: VOC family protein [Pseudomonadota bacterium]|nr:VOC family protein [Pseudomonadota bacterium]MEC8867802.1 VOC family protein [Pseudomonadota bacterium]MEC9285888.1 VOC family protein [Pseudomonadota bacterium]MEE3182709.1 VOC family protein [Pseudomonadota bacterium]